MREAPDQGARRVLGAGDGGRSEWRGGRLPGRPEGIEPWHIRFDGGWLEGARSESLADGGSINPRVGDRVTLKPFGEFSPCTRFMSLRGYPCVIVARHIVLQWLQSNGLFAESEFEAASVGSSRIADTAILAARPALSASPCRIAPNGVLNGPSSGRAGDPSRAPRASSRLPIPATFFARRETGERYP